MVEQISCPTRIIGSRLVRIHPTYKSSMSERGCHGLVSEGNMAVQEHSGVDRINSYSDTELPRTHTSVILHAGGGPRKRKFISPSLGHAIARRTEFDPSRTRTIYYRIITDFLQTFYSVILACRPRLRTSTTNSQPP